MRRERRSRLPGKREKSQIDSFVWPRELILYILLIAVFVASSTIFIFQTPAENWPDIIDYIISNPLTVSIIGALVVFLILDRFRELSKSLGDLDNRVHEQQGSFQRELEDRVDDAQRKLSDKWQRVETKLGDISQTYPFLDDINNFDILVNAPTAVAALKNIEILIGSDRPNLAYHILHQVAMESDLADEKFSGSPNQFETLGLLAFALFDDSYLCDRLLVRAARGANERGIVWAARRLQLAALTGRVALVVELSEYLSKRLSERYWSFLPGKANIERMLAERDIVEIKTALSLSQAVIGDQQFSSFLLIGRKKSWPVPAGMNGFYDDVLSVAGLSHSSDAGTYFKRPSRSAAAMLELVRLKHTNNITAPEKALSLLADHDPLVRSIFHITLSLAVKAQPKHKVNLAESYRNTDANSAEPDAQLPESDIIPGYDEWKADNPDPYTTNPDITLKRTRIGRRSPKIKPSDLRGMKNSGEDESSDDDN
jgi:hypothetical protein